MTRKAQVLIGGGAVVAAAVYIVLSSSEPAPGRGYYDERGHYVVPLTPEDRRRLAPRPPAHPRQSRIVEVVEQKFRTGSGTSSLVGFSPGCIAVWSTWRVEVAIDNGGFDHCFGIAPDPVPNLALEGFRLLGAPAYADVMKRAIALRNENPARAPGSPLYGLLDEAFYKLGDAEPLDGLRARYIDAHPEEFPK